MFQYETEDRGALGRAVTTAVIAGSVAAVIVGVIALIAAGIFLPSCGGNGSEGGPVYQNDICVKNCGNNGDGWVAVADGYIYPPGDSCNGDTCSAQPQYDTVTGACEAIKAGKKPPEVCVPQAYKKAGCNKLDGACEKGGRAYCFEYDDDGVCKDGGIPCLTLDDSRRGPPALQCVSDKADCADGFTSGICFNYPINKECKSKKDCSVPCDAWPPEVCWGLPCLLAEKWDCDGYINDLTDAEFYDNGDGYCRIHSPTDPNDDLYYKPGDDHVQRPPFGEPVEEKYTVLDGGSQLKGDGSAGTFTCTKLVEEQ